MRFLVALAACAVSASQTMVAAQAPVDAEAVTRAFREVLARGDVARLGRHFADSVVFEGDARFIGAAEKPGRHPVTRSQLSDAFGRLFDQMGRGEWSAMINQTVPTLNRAAQDAEHHALAKAGDFVLALRLPGFSGPDDSLVFVFRNVAGRLLVVAHHGDY